VPATTLAWLESEAGRGVSERLRREAETAAGAGGAKAAPAPRRN
jgi:hypothetical protein